MPALGGVLCLSYNAQVKGHREPAHVRMVEGYHVVNGVLDARCNG